MLMSNYQWESGMQMRRFGITAKECNWTGPNVGIFIKPLAEVRRITQRG